MDFWIACIFLSILVLGGLIFGLTLRVENLEDKARNNKFVVQIDRHTTTPQVNWKVTYHPPDSSVTECYAGVSPNYSTAQSAVEELMNKIMHNKIKTGTFWR